MLAGGGGGGSKVANVIEEELEDDFGGGAALDEELELELDDDAAALVALHQYFPRSPPLRLLRIIVSTLLAGAMQNRGVSTSEFLTLMCKPATLSRTVFWFRVTLYGPATLLRTVFRFRVMLYKLETFLPYLILQVSTLTQ